MPPHPLRASFLARAVVAVIAAVLAAGAPGPTRADVNVFGLHFGSGERVVGSSRVQSEHRAVGGFQAIVLRGSMKLVLHQGAREGVELRADDNLLALIETRVVDRGGVPTLEIGTRPGVSLSSRDPVVATVDLTTLNSLLVSGSGDVESEALKSAALKLAISGTGNVRLQRLEVGELVLRISGSGDIRCAGRADRLAVSISGSGNVDSRSLEADDVSVGIAGSGNANLTARKNLTVSISGNGNVVYAGDAALRSSIAGHGNVRRQ